MQLFTTPHVKGPHCNLYVISDSHCGCNDWKRDALQADIKLIYNDPLALVVFPGDTLHNDLTSSVGSCYEQQIPPGEQKYVMRDMLMPIKDKIVGMITGNHENRTKEDARNIKDLALFLGVPYFTDEICIAIPVGNDRNHAQVYTGYGIHGSCNSSNVGAVATALQRLDGICDADFYFMGHCHQPLQFPLTWFRRDLYNKKMIPIIRQYFASGSYQGREKYPVTKGMRPKVLGSPVIRLDGTKKEMKVELPNKVI